MQSIARLAGPVVHGFKRGSKLLGWCGACGMIRALALVTVTLNSPPAARVLAVIALDSLARRPTANLGASDAELEALAPGASPARGAAPVAVLLTSAPARRCLHRVRYCSWAGAVQGCHQRGVSAAAALTQRWFSPAPQGWNPFFNNEKKTIEAYLLHQFDRYCLPWICLQRFLRTRALSFTLPQRLLRRAHAFDSRALFAA